MSDNTKPAIAKPRLAPTTTGFVAKWLKTSNPLDEEDFDLDKATAFFLEEARISPVGNPRRGNALQMVDWLNELKQLRGYQNQPPFARKLQKLSNTFLKLAGVGVKIADKGLSLADRFDEFAYRDWK